MYTRLKCIYCDQQLVDGYCPTCEPEHFIKDERELVLHSDTDKGKPRRPGAWK